MPYHKNKQEAFQAAQQAVEEAQQATENIANHSPDEGRMRKRAVKEIMEAEEQVQKAYTVSSERQHEQLDQYQQVISDFKEQLPPE
ncbi:hypothetical protein GN156_00290 [bacterium LRH843]|nr:hypothetical protein [bacterium LRH843]